MFLQSVLVQLKELSSLDPVRVVVTCRSSARLVAEGADGLKVMNYPVSDKTFAHGNHIARDTAIRLLTVPRLLQSRRSAPLLNR